ncbi:hypothetical protein HPB52_020034 [Rhipicephalus sanguineus]|uniref:Uncharacterized protein n=1 Tax=Rhipicephalus sanguineus TaxID=34632 RepID=A0A9D4YQP4_RHISA|nr:hypothetical protein HPB52_020034 [Rhipicephalus sanguineus]
MPKTSPKKAPAAKPNKPEPKRTHTGPSTNVKPGTPSKPPVLMVKDFPPLTPVQAQCDSPQLKRKTASRQAVDEDFSGLAPGGPVRPPMAATPAPGPGRSPAP